MASPGYVSLKERQRRERETLILQVAEEIINEKGYNNASMEEIATRVGVAKATIYSHFPSKEELVVAIFERDMSAFIEGIDTITADQPTARARLEALLHFVGANLFQKHMSLFSTAYNILTVRYHVPQDDSRFHQQWQRLMDQVCLLLEEGKAAGEFKQTIPTEIMIYALFSMFMARRISKHLLKNANPTPELLQQILNVYFDGISEK